MWWLKSRIYWQVRVLHLNKREWRGIYIVIFKINAHDFMTYLFRNIIFFCSYPSYCANNRVFIFTFPFPSHEALRWNSRQLDRKTKKRQRPRKLGRRNSPSASDVKNFCAYFTFLYLSRDLCVFWRLLWVQQESLVMRNC